MKFCVHCGKELASDASFCMNCGNVVSDQTAAGPSGTNKNAANQRCLPAFVVGLIGSIFGLFGGMCVSACYSLSGNDGVPMFFLVGGSLIGLIGSCMCFSKARLGAILQLVAAGMIAICAFGITGADVTTLMGMLLLGVGGVVGLLMTKPKK